MTRWLVSYGASAVGGSRWREASPVEAVGQARFATIDGQSVLVELDRPVGAEALALVVSGGPADDRTGRLLAGFATHGIATTRVRLPVGLGDRAATAAWLAKVAAWTHAEADQDLPLCFSAVGAAAPFVLEAAASTRPLAGVVTWNAALWPARRTLADIDVPALLLVDHDRRARQWVQRLAARRFGGPAAMVPVADDPAETLARFLTDPTSVLEDRRPTRSVARRMAPVVLTSALVLPVLVAPVARAERRTDRFDAAVSVRVTGVPGAKHPGNQRPDPDKVAKWAARGIDPSRVGGDGVHAQATGSVHPTVAGIEWFVNTDITFSTSSSASGALSAASFQGPHPVTTQGGGVVSSTLTDAFNGYHGLYLQAADGPLQAPDVGNAAERFYEKLGRGTVECGGDQVQFPTQTDGQVTVQRTTYIGSGFARWVDSFTNTGAAPTTITIGYSNDLGSGTHTTFDQSSDGHIPADVGATWLTSYGYSSNHLTGPPLGHVFSGPGAPTKLAAINTSFGTGHRNPYWGYTLTIAPGATQSIMNFVTLNNSRAQAASTAANLATNIPDLQTKGDLACLSDPAIASIVNFAQPATPTTPTEPATPAAVLITPKFTG